ncbi:MAG: sugar phosphate isomerase/epimerase [Kiritimatiellae bacterium]|nr:sugar phosphate isomerase/epimerase [Kiritimatiellia bacterium]
MKVICGFTIPITKYGLPPSVDNLLKVIKEVGDAGFDALEMEIETGNREYAERWDEVIARSKEQKVRVPSIMCVAYEMFSLDPAIQKASAAEFERICGMIQAMGAKLATLCFYLPPELIPEERTALYRGGPPVEVKIPDGFKWSTFRNVVIRQLSRCADAAARRKLDFAVELRAGDFLSSADGLIGIFEACRRKNMGVVFDVAHIHATKEYLEMGILKFGKKYLKLIHLSDNDGTQAYHNVPGKGNINFPKVIGMLKQVGYKGNLVVDISGVPRIMSEAVKMKRMLEDLIEQA